VSRSLRMAALPSSRHPERERLVDGDDSGGLGDRLMVERERADEASFDATQPAGAVGCPSTVSSDYRDRNDAGVARAHGPDLQIARGRAGRLLPLREQQQPPRRIALLLRTTSRHATRLDPVHAVHRQGVSAREVPRGRSSNTVALAMRDDRARWTARLLAGLPRELHGRLADLDQVPIGIADVAADLGSAVLRRGEELGPPRAPVLINGLDVGDADV
jgi:hypothetical protein